MKPADFVHLHNHSDYSLLDGASPIPRMVKRAAELGMPAVALTDHGAMFGAIEFHNEAKKAGVKPIIGMEAYVTRGSRKDRTRDTAHHLVLLARDEQGFKNLIRLSSLAFLEGFYYKPRVDHEILHQYSAGITALSACPKGEIAMDLLEGNEEGAVKTAEMYRDIFGDGNFFLEVQNHGLEIEDRIRAGVTQLAKRTGLPMVATNDCHYLQHNHANAHDVLLCIQTGKNVSDQKRMRYETDQVYFKTGDEMRARFGDLPDALKNTLRVAEMCSLNLKFDKPLLPEFPLPPEWNTAEDYLRRLIDEGLSWRYKGEAGDDIRQRADYEFGVICKMGFASYFLIVRDFIAFARSQGIGVGPGRGSVAGSLVAYALRITDIDPLEHGLIFERFLNPERVTMPDIDIDFDDLRRGEVIKYVREKYGDGSVTQIITFGTMGAKGVVRDVGRALGLAFAEVDKIAKMVPDGLGMTLERALELSPDLKNIGSKGPEFARLLESAKVLEGLARHASTHAAGVLITPGPLTDYVPLYRQKDESVTTQWDMNSVEKAGLLKMDFLGLRTLSVLDECVRLVKQHRGVELDLSGLKLDDPKAYRIFQTADTVAIFQFESGGMRDYLRKLKATVFGDLTAMNALYRPGPMENIPYFIDCKHGRQVAKFDHKALEPILKDTYGVFVYQEQVMAAAHALAGFTMSEADELRRAMGKKLHEEMEKKRKQFIEGCGKNSITPKIADRIFTTMEKFAGYGFNRCLLANTVIVDADTGRRTTIGDLFKRRQSMRVHALGSDWKLRPRRVKDVVWNGVREVFTLRTALGKQIGATSNHPLLTLRGWKTIAELKACDRIAVPRSLSHGSQKHWPAHELITLAGLIAEGNTCHPTTLYFFCNEQPIIDDFHRAISQFENTVARIYSRGDGRLEVHANLGKHYRVREPEEFYAYEGALALVREGQSVHSGVFRWAEHLGLLGKKATEKCVPPEIFELADSDITLFLGRLWSGDGFISDKHNNAPFYATSSPQLAKDVQSLLLRVGLVSTIHAKLFNYRGGQRPGYTVNLTGGEIRERFLEVICPHIVGRERALAHLRTQISELRGDRSSKDTVPAEIVELIESERRRVGMTWKELRARSGLSKARTRLASGYRRSTLRKIASALGSTELAHLANSDVFWDRIVSIEPAGVEDVYDLEIENDHNFVADGLIVHNSHSAAYALLAYQSAYLKAHYPAEFMAATLTSEMSDSTRIATLIEECRRMKLEILPPDASLSGWKFTLEDGKIRYAMGAVRNVGQGAVDAIVSARAAGQFRDIFDLAARLDSKAVNKRVLESLVAAGACDAMGPERGQLFAAAGVALEQAAVLQRERASGQSSLFGDPGSATATEAPSRLPMAQAWTAKERTSKEKEALGFFLSDHPMAPLRKEIDSVVSHDIAGLAELPDGTEVRVAALIGEIKNVVTKKGHRMAVLTLEDLTGRIEATVFPDVYESSNRHFIIDEIVVINGKMESRDDRGTKLLAAEVMPWSSARAAYRPSLKLEMRAVELTEEWLESVDGILNSHRGDADVYLLIVMSDGSREETRARRYRVAEGDEVIRALVGRWPSLRVRWSKEIA